MKIRLHDRQKILKESPAGAKLNYSDRQHVILPSGQEVRIQQKDRRLPGKTLRRLRIKARQLARASK